VCFQKRIFQGSMILMQLPPTGLQKAENILCPSVVIRLQRSHYDTALKRGVSFPHRHFHTGLRQMRVQKTANDSRFFRCIKHSSHPFPQTGTIVT